MHSLRIWLPALLLAVLLVPSANAQTHEAGPMGQLNLRGFVAPEAGYSSLDGEPAWLAGGTLAAFIDRGFYMGVGGWTTVNEVAADPVWQVDTWHSTHYSMTLGGLVIGYMIAPERPVHFGGELVLGVGSIERALSYESDVDFDPDPDNLYFARSSLRAAWAVTDWLQLVGMAGFRMTGAVDRLGLDTASASAAVVRLGLAAGAF